MCVLLLESDGSISLRTAYGFLAEMGSVVGRLGRCFLRSVHERDGGVYGVGQTSSAMKMRFGSWSGGAQREAKALSLVFGSGL